jgi:hypothetical protein
LKEKIANLERKNRQQSEEIFMLREESFNQRFEIRKLKMDLEQKSLAENAIKSLLFENLVR